MDWTGERLETFIENQTTIEHLHRYAFTRDYIKGKIVLDLACGSGYGSNMMAAYASHVIGVDISEKTVQEARKKYLRENLCFKAGNATAIPQDNGSVDVVVSFETIEHLTGHKEMLMEIKRVLKPDGMLIMSSPDKKYYSDIPGYRNPFHLKELYSEEFEHLIAGYFKKKIFLSQNIFYGSLIAPNEKVYGFRFLRGNYETTEYDLSFNPLYNIVLASDKDIIAPSLSAFDGMATLKKESERIIAEKDAIIHNLMESKEYRTGHLIFYPLRLIKRMFRKIFE